MTQKLNFTASQSDQELIGKIVTRAVMLGREFEVDLDHVTLAMDITALHCNGTPLKLLQLLMSDNSDFTHDVFSIIHYINRETGKIDPGVFLWFSV